MTKGQAPVRVAYIHGTARSGSTILGAILGSHAEVVGGGELSNLTRGVPQRDPYCSCGALRVSCPIWSELFARWEGHSPQEYPQRFAAYYASFERIRSLPRVLREAGTPSATFSQYADEVRWLFQTISELGEGGMVVDTSKGPVRGLALSLVPGLDLRHIHLVRDGRGVARSVTKGMEAGKPLQGAKRSIRVVYAALDWVLNNWLAEYVRRKSGGKGILVRYEDLVTQPLRVLARIGELLEVDLKAVGAALERQEPISFGHTVQGNPVRLGGPVPLRLDDSWRHVLSRGDQGLFWLVGGRLARRYGYKPMPRRQGPIRGGARGPT